MHTHQFFTWITHSIEHTTLLGQHTLQRQQLYQTTRSSTHMCNIVTEFYLYSIVYIYLINSRLDVTHSVRHHFRTINFITDYNSCIRLQLVSIITVVCIYRSVMISIDLFETTQKKCTGNPRQNSV